MRETQPVVSKQTDSRPTSLPEADSLGNVDAEISSLDECFL
jgi:hypothetical protein